MQEYQFVNDTILFQVNDVMTKFTNQLYEEISKAEEWMKVTPLLHHKSRIFTLDIDSDDIKKTQNFLSNSKDVNKVADYVFSIILEKIDSQLNQVKHKLHTEFMANLDKSIDQLVEDIIRNKKGASLTNLIQHIGVCRDELKENINTACEWFTLIERVDLIDATLARIVGLATRCYSQVNSNDHTVLTSIKNDGLVHGKYVVPITLAFLNIYSNASKYGTHKSDIYVSGDSDNKGNFTLTTTNSISDEDYRALKNGKIEEIRKKIRSQKSLELLANEGGTGLYKSRHELISASEKFDLDVSVSNSQFNVHITYEQK